VSHRLGAHSAAFVLGAIVAASPVAMHGDAGRSPGPGDDVRGLWVGRAVLSSPASIAAMVRDAEATGINTIFVQVRGRGETFYRSRLEPRASELASQPAAFDPLAETLARAREAGLRVHAWVNVNLVASAVTLPASPSHVARRHPEWLMVPRALAATLAGRSPRSAGYLAGLATWTAAASARVEGLYLSPLVPGAQDHTVSIIRELAQRYPLDGIHLDYIRFPGPDFDYNRTALSEFRRTVAGRGVVPADRRRLDRASGADPTVWARTYPAAWSAFREERLTALLARLRAAALAERAGLAISAAVAPDSEIARTDKLQPWGRWADAGHLDAVCPMIYTADLEEFERLVAAARARLHDRADLWAGIGAYRLTPERTAANVRAARQAGAAGVLLFSYEALTAESATPLPVVRDLLRTALIGEPAVQSP
jgi:uncharacterized lipoprotein YddW (UPF0748 family)